MAIADLFKKMRTLMLENSHRTSLSVHKRMQDLEHSFTEEEQQQFRRDSQKPRNLHC